MKTTTLSALASGDRPSQTASKLGVRNGVIYACVETNGNGQTLGDLKLSNCHKGFRRTPGTSVARVACAGYRPRAGRGRPGLLARAEPREPKERKGLRDPRGLKETRATKVTRAPKARASARSGRSQSLTVRTRAA